MKTLEDFFNFFSVNSKGIFVFILLLITLITIIQWLARIFGWGNYKSLQEKEQNVGILYLLAQFITKIIDDFRNFLAFFLVLIFAIVLFYSIKINGDNDVPEGIENALQAVMSTLGTLIVAIIGYYFGESAAAKKNVVNPIINLESDTNVQEPEDKHEKDKKDNSEKKIKATEELNNLTNNKNE